MHGRIDCRIPAPDHDHATPYRHVREIVRLSHLLDEIDRVVHTLQSLTFQFERPHASQPDCKEHRVVLVSHVAQCRVAAEHHAGLHLDATHRVQPLHFALSEIFNHLVRRDAVFVQATGLGPGIEERDLVAIKRKTMRAGQSSRASPNHRHVTPCVRCAFEERLAACHRPVGGVTLQCADRNWFVILMIPDACPLAEYFSWTHTCAHAAQGIGRQDVHCRALHVAVADLANKAGYIYFRGARVDARSVVTIVATARSSRCRGGVE